MNTPKQFKIMVDGDDAQKIDIVEGYEAAMTHASELSVGHWLGYKVIGTKGYKIAAFFDGKQTGFRDGTTGEWVAR